VTELNGLGCDLRQTLGRIELEHSNPGSGPEVEVGRGINLQSPRGLGII
jgi:hypothetical protein